jgi:hypothetical protein
MTIRDAMNAGRWHFAESLFKDFWTNKFTCTSIQAINLWLQTNNQAWVSHVKKISYKFSK